MTRKTTFKSIDFNKYLEFQKVSQNFYHGAELAFEFEYFNASGVLVILSAIALADAVTIKKASKKSSSENHYDIIQLLLDATSFDKKKSN